MESRVSFADLFQSLSETFSRVISQQFELFQVEMSEKASRMSKGLVNLVIGGVVLTIGLLAMVAAAILALIIVMPAPLAALVVAVLFLIVGGIFLTVGLNKIKRTNLKPEKTISSMKDTVRAVQEGWQV